jgi:hypothetical protein
MLAPRRPQRGNSSTAIAGTVASAVRILARAILLGRDHLGRILPMSLKGWEISRGYLISERGPGRHCDASHL